jgi:hypothetical protein
MVSRENSLEDGTGRKFRCEMISSGTLVSPNAFRLTCVDDRWCSGALNFLEAPPLVRTEIRLITRRIRRVRLGQYADCRILS